MWTFQPLKCVVLKIFCQTLNLKTLVGKIIIIVTRNSLLLKLKLRITYRIITNKCMSFLQMFESLCRFITCINNVGQRLSSLATGQSTTLAEQMPLLEHSVTETVRKVFC